MAGGKSLLFDPFITPNGKARGIDVDKIAVDYIFVSHGHFDHTTDVVRIANRTGARVIGGWELNDWFRRCGLKNTYPLNPGGTLDLGVGSVKCFMAHHSNSLPDGSYGGVACGFAFKTSDGNFYYSGDTALSLDMGLIPAWSKLDFAVLPVGDGLTMGAGDASEAARLVGVRTVVGVHYDTFDFITIDHQQAKETFKQAEMTLHLLDIGATIQL